jgi:hypothetical protein
MSDRATLEREVAAWEAERNSLGATVDWLWEGKTAAASGGALVHVVQPAEDRT